jgi:four helix bundle protein
MRIDLKTNKKVDILERCVQYSLQIIKFFREIEKDSVGRILGNQLLRSGTSIGANVHEAQGGQSKADFIAKISIAQKEACESAYWLRIMLETKLGQSADIRKVRQETDELVRILSSILISAKERTKNVPDK